MYVKTIEVPDTIVSVATDENYKYYWVRNFGEEVVGIFKNSSGTGAEGPYAIVFPGECVRVIPEETTLYFASAKEGTTNKIEIYGTNTADCPFKAGKRGGDGGSGRTETVLWENDGTTNPDTITLSEAWSDFDELAIVTVSVGTVTTQYESTKYTSVMAIGSAYTMWYNSENTWGTYSATSSTVFTKISSGGDYHIQKIIGIKYGSGGGSGQYSGTYTPEGAVAVTPTTGTVTGVSANGTLPAVTYDTANEELTFTEGTLPTLDTDKSFVTGATAEFTGTQAIITVQ